jgi:hypothetical protein
VEVVGGCRVVVEVDLCLFGGDYGVCGGVGSEGSWSELLGGVLWVRGAGAYSLHQKTEHRQKKTEHPLKINWKSAK